MSECVFCQIVAGSAPASRQFEWPDALAFEPLNPVTPGHLLVVPKRHVADASVDAALTALTFGRAAELAVPACNIITSVGVEATQTVFHLHVHVVPRRAGDGLPLPWTPQQAAGAAAGLLSRWVDAWKHGVQHGESTSRLARESEAFINASG